MKILTVYFILSVYSQELILVTYALLRIKNNSAKLGLVTLNMFGVSKREHLNPTSYAFFQTNRASFMMLVGKYWCKVVICPWVMGWRQGKEKGENSRGNERTKPSNYEVIACVCAVGILQNMGLKKKQIWSYSRLVLYEAFGSFEMHLISNDIYCQSSQEIRSL